MRSTASPPVANRRQRQGSRRAVQAPPLTLTSVRPPLPHAVDSDVGRGRTAPFPHLCCSLRSQHPRLRNQSKFTATASTCPLHSQSTRSASLSTLYSAPCAHHLNSQRRRQTRFSLEFSVFRLGGPPCRAGTMRPTQAEKHAGWVIRTALGNTKAINWRQTNENIQR